MSAAPSGDPDPGAAPSRALGALAAVAAALAWLAFGTQPELRAADLAQSSVFDFVFYYAPNAEHLAARLARGELPLWNPQQALGEPFLASLQPAVFYPPTWLQVLVAPATAFAIAAALHVGLAAWFASRLALAFGAGALSAPLAGFLFATCFDVTANALVPPILAATAWMPAVWLALLRCIDRPSTARALALAAAVSFQVLCGWPYQVALTLLGGAVLAPAVFVSKPRARIPRALVSLAVAAALAAMFAAPQLLPALELLPQTTRAFGSISAAQAVFAGGPHDAAQYGARLAAQGAATGIPSVLALGLACVGIATPRPPRAARVALAGVAALCFAASFPHALPVYEWLRALPLLGDFRFPFRYRSVAALAISVLAAVGVEGAIALARGRVSSRRAVLAAVVACVAASRFACAPLSPLRMPRALPPALSLDSMLGPALAEHAAAPESGSRSRLFWSGREGKLGALGPVDAAFDLEPLTLARTAHAMRALVDPREPRTGMARPGEPDDSAAAPFYGKAQLRRATRARLLDALAVDLVAFDRPREWQLHAFEPIAQGPPALYRNPGALQRAYHVSRAEREPHDVDSAMQRLLDPGFDLARQVMLDEVPDALARAAASSEAPARATAQIERYEPERVRIRSSGAEPGIVVLADAWYPGWSAEVDGVPARVLRANALFRGVAVPAGEHVIELRYASASAGVGVALAAAAAVLAAVIGLGALRRRAAAES